MPFRFRIALMTLCSWFAAGNVKLACLPEAPVEHRAVGVWCCAVHARALTQRCMLDFADAASGPARSADGVPSIARDVWHGACGKPCRMGYSSARTGHIMQIPIAHFVRNVMHALRMSATQRVRSLLRI
jgi:hypothetical protein